MRSTLRQLFVLRGSIPLWLEIACGILCVLLCFGIWWYVTRGEPEQRLVPYTFVPSPKETFDSFYPGLWVERELTRNTLATLRRLVLGFGLAALVGIPLGVACGCFAPVNAFFLPLTIFGRNIPLAALIGLTILVFGIEEKQKVMFIFIACVAFIVSDTARAVMDVSNQYVDTAYTLGATRWQIIRKVLVPLAMPSVFNSLRLLFGLAFGYIMLAETIHTAGESGGLGHIINTSLRRSELKHIYLVLLIIPLVALAIDQILFWIQRQLFPHRYAGAGLLNLALTALAHGWDDVKALLWKPSAAAQPVLAQSHDHEATKK